MFLLNFIWNLRSSSLLSGFAPAYSGRRIVGRDWENPNRIGWLNIFLAVSALGLFVYYVITTNAITAKEYSVKALSDRLVAVQDINGTLVAERSNTDAHTVILNFARERSMVEVRDGLHLVQPGGMALK